MIGSKLSASRVVPRSRVTLCGAALIPTSSSGIPLVTEPKIRLRYSAILRPLYHGAKVAKGIGNQTFAAFATFAPRFGGLKMKCCGILYLPGALGFTRISGGVVTGYYRLQPSYSGSEFPRLTCKSHDKIKFSDLWTQWTELRSCGYSVHLIHSVQW